MSSGALHGDFQAAVKLQQLWNKVGMLLENSLVRTRGQVFLDTYQQ